MVKELWGFYKWGVEHRNTSIFLFFTFLTISVGIAVTVILVLLVKAIPSLLVVTPAVIIYLLWGQYKKETGE